MIELNLPTYDFKIRSKENYQEIFDEIRKKFVILTAEEWVRQHIIKYLIQEKGYLKSLIVVEMTLFSGTQQLRADAVLHHIDGTPLMLIECKAPEVKINQQTFDQVAVYAMRLKIRYVLLTNGLVHYCCMIDKQEKKYIFLQAIPFYKDIKPNSD